MSDAAGPIGRPVDAEELLAQAAWLRALARRLVRDEHAADDVVQETFVAAVGRPPRESGALRGWLAKVARHAAWKSVRSDRRRAAREDAAPRRPSEPSAAECVERIEMQRALLDAVQELEPPYRVVVMMRFYDGKAPREIARELGVPPEVVWQRLSRATAMLRARLDRRYGKRDAWALVLISPLGSRWSATWGSGAAVATGVTIVGTKTVLAAAAIVGLGAWLVWPRGDVDATRLASTNPAAVAAASETVAKPAVAPRAKRDADPEATVVAPPTATPRGRTRGRVVDEATGEPVAGAKVEILRKSAGGGFVWNLETGADGTFAGETAQTATWSGLSWSDLHYDCNINATAPGYLRFHDDSGSGPKDEDLGDLKLDRGRIVRGTVVDGEGRPAPGAIVFVGGSGLRGSNFPLQEARRHATSDVAGRFELDEGLAPTTDENVYTLLATTPKGVAFTTLAVRKGREPIEGVVLAVHAATVTVRVTGPDGLPFVGARVVAQPRFGALRGASQPDATLFKISDDPALTVAFVRETDADGRVVFDGLPVEDGAAIYDVGVTAAGCSPVWQNDCRVPGADILIALHREQRLVAGVRVVDVDGRPLAGVHVSGVAKPGETDADGVFVVGRSSGDPGGLFAQVRLTKDGFAQIRYASATNVLDDGKPLPEIRMERQAPVEGRVVDQSDRPVGGAFVVLTRDGACCNLPGRGLTGADGRFVFEDATAGAWSVVVVPEKGSDYVQPPDTPVAGGARDVVVRVTRLPPARVNVVVDVVDAVTGAPFDAEDTDFHTAAFAHGATVSLPKPRIDAGRVTVGPLRPGDYGLWLRIAGRPHQLVPLHIAEGATDVHATCRVRRGVAISGRIRTPEGFEGKPLRGATYQPRDAEYVPGGGLSWPVTSQGHLSPGGDGAFRVEGVTPTVYRVSIRDRGWYADVVVDASAGDATVELEPRRGVVLRMRGSDPVNAECVWIEGSLDGAPWSVIDQASVNEGQFDDTETMPPGTLRWRAKFRRSLNSNEAADAADPQSGEVLLESGKDVEIVIPVVVRK